jgi:hypothetical protein
MWYTHEKSDAMQPMVADGGRFTGNLISPSSLTVWAPSENFQEHGPMVSNVRIAMWHLHLKNKGNLQSVDSYK